jgi:hypothetical protein
LGRLLSEQLDVRGRKRFTDILEKKKKKRKKKKKYFSRSGTTGLRPVATIKRRYAANGSNSDNKNGNNTLTLPSPVKGEG